MNTRFLFSTFLLTAPLMGLVGCGTGSNPASHPQTHAVATLDQPISLRGPIAAPSGWALSQPVRPEGHVAHYRGQAITEMDALHVYPVSPDALAQVRERTRRPIGRSEGMVEAFTGP